MISYYVLFNIWIILPHIKKLTIPEEKDGIKPLPGDIVLILFVYFMGVLSYLFLKQIRQYRTIKYNKMRLKLIRSFNYGDKFTKEVKELERAFKLRKIHKEARINKFKHSLNPFK